MKTLLISLLILMQIIISPGDTGGVQIWDGGGPSSPAPLSTPTPAPALDTTRGLGWPFAEPTCEQTIPAVEGTASRVSLIWPVSGSINDNRGFRTGHTGIDINAPIGTTVVAAYGGTVVYSGYSIRGFGNLVVLDHENFQTYYAHLSSVEASCGAYVIAGTPIGRTGQTGAASWPHLHFEIRLGVTSFDPLDWLRR